jgi:hypothetical protein
MLSSMSHRRQQQQSRLAWCEGWLQAANDPAACGWGVHPPQTASNTGSRGCEERSDGCGVAAGLARPSHSQGTPSVPQLGDWACGVMAAAGSWNVGCMPRPTCAILPTALQRAACLLPCCKPLMSGPVPLRLLWATHRPLLQQYCQQQSCSGHGGQRPSLFAVWLPLAIARYFLLVPPAEGPLGVLNNA